LDSNCNALGYFFHAIHVSNVSITLSVFSLGAFFASILEPLLWSEGIVVQVFFGLSLITGLGMIMQVRN
jgi:uncharacterized membrane protein